MSDNNETVVNSPDDVAFEEKVEQVEKAATQHDSDMADTGEQQSAQETPEQTVRDQASNGQQMYHLPPGYAIDPVTGQVVFIGQPMAPPQQQYIHPGYQQVPLQPTPEEVAAMQAAEQQKYAQVVGSVEQFLAGDATVADVVKTMYVNMSQNDNLWKGVLVGAAAAIVLTSDPVKDAMGKTIGGLFPGLKERVSDSIDPEK